MTTKEIIDEQIKRLEWKINYTRGHLDELCKKAEDTGYDVYKDGDSVTVNSRKPWRTRMMQSDMDETRGIIMGLSIVLNEAKKLAVILDKSDELSANEAHKLTDLSPWPSMRYIGDSDLLEYGKIYSHCSVKFIAMPSECNIEVFVTDPGKGLISMQMLYSSYADMLREWELIG